MTETTLTAKPALLVVTPGSSETTFITYSKDQDENIFERTWTIAAAAAPDWSPHVGSVDEGPEHGEYKKTLKSGMKYEVGVFQKGGGPGSSEPRQHADLIVYCISNTREMGLITDENHDRGGTWASLRVIAHDCEVVAAGASRTTPSLAGAGFPRLTAPEGNVTANITVQGGGIVAIDLMCSPLLPGNPYFFVVLVADSVGNWDFRQILLTTKRRKLTVEFPGVVIKNDGDPHGHGEAHFTFGVWTGPTGREVPIEEFNTGVMDIDDWSETGRPYSIGFAHVGLPEIVTPDTLRVGAQSRGIEMDGPVESDEVCEGFQLLDLPTGKIAETVDPAQDFQFKCLPKGGEDFQYFTNVSFSVTYVE